jgi:hypothetical protein
MISSVRAPARLLCRIGDRPDGERIGRNAISPIKYDRALVQIGPSSRSPSISDVDLWVIDPVGRPVVYGSRQVGCASLDRDSTTIRHH